MNKAAGFASAFLFTAVAPLLDPVSHKVGISVLTLRSMEPLFASLYTIPLGPWIGFHNSVTLGSFLLGLYLTYPVYLSVRALCDRIRDPRADWLLQRPAAEPSHNAANHLGVGP